MAIYLRGKSWYYDFVHKGQRYTGSFGPVSRTVAKEEEHRKKTEVIEQRLNPAKARKSPRFDAFAEEYLEWVQANKKLSTYKRIFSAVGSLSASFGQKKLSELTPWHLEQYKKARKEAGKALLTINHELAFLKAMLRRAQVWGKLAEHPGKEVKPFKVPEGKPRFLTEEEEARVLAVSSPALRRIVGVGLLTGFRRQELTSLRPEDVDLEREAVSVAASYAKNGEHRTLPTGPRLKALLQTALVTCGNVPTVFVEDTGEPWTPKSFAKAFTEACEQAEVKVSGPHVLRHTFASRLVMAGVDLRTVQELMGHKSITMTLRYAHLSPHHKRHAMETLESRFPTKSPADFHNTPPAVPPVSGAKTLAIR
jgi:integrase